mmetsp:Transcript_3745/g.10571  ORF Transcript_3745/g.10571 Transcript_3745/m.10571 type:complete len:245 (-) Transcript_3745:938-1672(-)
MHAAATTRSARAPAAGRSASSLRTPCRASSRSAAAVHTARRSSACSTCTPRAARRPTATCRAAVSSRSCGGGRPAGRRTSAARRMPRCSARRRCSQRERAHARSHARSDLCRLPPRHSGFERTRRPDTRFSAYWDRTTPTSGRSRSAAPQPRSHHAARSRSGQLLQPCAAERGCRHVCPARMRAQPCGPVFFDAAVRMRAPQLMRAPFFWRLPVTNLRPPSCAGLTIYTHTLNFLLLHPCYHRA